MDPTDQNLKRSRYCSDVAVRLPPKMGIAPHVLCVLEMAHTNRLYSYEEGLRYTRFRHKGFTMHYEDSSGFVWTQYEDGDGFVYFVNESTQVVFF